MLLNNLSDITVLHHNRTAKRVFYVPAFICNNQTRQTQRYLYFFCRSSRRCGSQQTDAASALNI